MHKCSIKLTNKYINIYGLKLILRVNKYALRLHCWSFDIITGRHFLFFLLILTTVVRRSRVTTSTRFDSYFTFDWSQRTLLSPPYNKNMYHYGLRCFSLTLFGLRRENFNFFARTADSNLPNGCLNLFKVDIFRKKMKN